MKFKYFLKHGLFLDEKFETNLEGRGNGVRMKLHILTTHINRKVGCAFEKLHFFPEVICTRDVAETLAGIPMHSWLTVDILRVLFVTIHDDLRLAVMPNGGPKISAKGLRQWCIFLRSP